MRAKDRFLKKTNYILFLTIFLIFKNLGASDIKSELLNYNSTLKNSSIGFIQSDGITVEEGIIYIGFDRIKIEYEKPQKISLVLSKKKSMYINHSLEEVQYFDTNKSVIKIFFNILSDENFYQNSNITSLKDSITIKENFNLNDKFYKIKIIYENEPIKIRKIKLEEQGGNIDIGFFNHNSIEVFKKEFFSLINPYIN